MSTPRAKTAKPKQPPGPPDVVWVTTVGASSCAVTNSIWRAIDEELCRPAEIVLLCMPDDPLVAATLRRCEPTIATLGKCYLRQAPKVRRVTFDENDPDQFLAAARETVRDIGSAGRRAALDVTAGRKYMSAFLTQVGLECREHIHAIYYNHLTARQYEQTDFALVPRVRHELRDLLAMFEPTCPTPERKEGLR